MIKEIRYKNDMLASTLLNPIDYSDCFKIEADYKSIDDFAKNYFLSQPAWLRVVSFGVFSQHSLETMINETRFEKDDSIGQWKVYGRDENEIVFGQDMGFMEYCFAFHHDSNESLRVATVVQYKGKMGRFYFSVVSLLHKSFVRLSLKNTLRRRKK